MHEEDETQETTEDEDGGIPSEEAFGTPTITQGPPPDKASEPEPQEGGGDDSATKEDRGDDEAPAAELCPLPALWVILETDGGMIHSCNQHLNELVSNETAGIDPIPAEGPEQRCDFELPEEIDPAKQLVSTTGDFTPEELVSLYEQGYLVVGVPVTPAGERFKVGIGRNIHPGLLMGIVETLVTGKMSRLTPPQVLGLCELIKLKAERTLAMLWMQQDMRAAEKQQQLDRTQRMLQEHPQGPPGLIMPTRGLRRKS